MEYKIQHDVFTLGYIKYKSSKTMFDVIITYFFEINPLVI